MLYTSLHAFLHQLKSFSYTLKLVTFLYFDSLVFYIISVYLLTQWVSPFFSFLSVLGALLLFLARESIYAPMLVVTLFYAFLFLTPLSADHIVLAMIVCAAQLRFLVRKAHDAQSSQERLQFLSRALTDEQRVQEEL